MIERIVIPEPAPKQTAKEQWGELAAMVLPIVFTIGFYLGLLGLAALLTMWVGTT